MSILQFLRILIARRWIILVSLVACFVVAVAIGKLLPPRYPAHARIIMDNFKPDPVTGTVIGGAAMRGFAATQIQLIKDYRVAGDVVDRLGLMNSPEAQAVGSPLEARRRMAERIMAGTTANLIEGSAILEITYEGPSPELAKQTVNALRDAYIDNSLRFRTDSAGRSAEWYRDQADKALRALKAAEANKAKFESENNIVITAAGEAETAKLAGLQAALTAARSNEGNRQVGIAAQTMAPGLSDQLKMQLATLNDQIAQASEKLGTEHPAYKSLLARRGLLQRQISTEEGRERAATSAQLGASQQSIAQLEAQIAQQRAVVFGMKDKLDQDMQLAREVELRRGQYEKAAQRAADFQLESNISDAGLLVLGDAFADNSPSFPNWALIIPLSLAVGLGLGVTLSLVVELLNRRVRGPEDLAYAARVPVFAVIGERPKTGWRASLRGLLQRRGRSADMQPAQ